MHKIKKAVSMEAAFFISLADLTDHADFNTRSKLKKRFHRLINNFWLKPIPIEFIHLDFIKIYTYTN
ncbi:hypothetical protein BOQ64_01405 [Chryseobacterium sp. CH25]|nr:hypothetical protein BOQ64_01405 [Chryseobacterium sp. CH25]RXM65717.1 hypothetical protein BOQ60_08100 [Chryseobacterium sp. CH1]